MNKSISILVVLILSLSTTVACNLQSGTQPSVSVNDQAATIIAQTLTAQADNLKNVTATTTFTAILKATSTTGVTATITPTYSVPMLTLREQTNCRNGPGQDYDILFAYVKGVKREIIGYYPQENWWLVKAPESATGECWIWGEFADVTGSYWVVPTVTPPPTATLAPPKAPGITKWDFFCNTASGEMTITILWKDNASNETGFNVYRDGEKIAELPADSNSYTETIIVKTGQTVKYQIEVYGPSGNVMSSVISITC